MQYGLSPMLARRVRGTGFPSELDESPYDMVFSRGLAEPQPNHTFAASTGYYLTNSYEEDGETVALIEREDENGLFAHLWPHPERYEWMERAPVDLCFGWTSYPRFAPSIYEVKLVNALFPNTGAIPMSSERAARTTHSTFIARHPQWADNVNIVERQGIWFIEIPKINPDVQYLFPEFREVREYLGTGMSPREAAFHLLRISEKSPITISLQESRDLSNDICDEYRRQFLLAHGMRPLVSTNDMYVRPNATYALIDVVNSLGIEHPKVGTVGVPYSDTPITLDMVTGHKPTNSRSHNVFDIMESARDADVMVLELGDNPLLDAPDLVALDAYCFARGIPMVIDVSVVGSMNVDFAKLFNLKSVAGAVVSTTKYSSGTVMGGVFIANARCEWDGYKDFSHNMTLLENNDMHWSDGAVHTRDIATWNQRQKVHNRNAAELADMLESIPGLKINYPTKNGSKRNIDPFLKKDAGYGCVLSLEFDRALYSQDEIRDIINELPKHMTNCLSFGLPRSSALEYPATVFPGKPQSVTGVDPFLIRISMGCHAGESVEVNAAIRTSVANVVGIDRLLTGHFAAAR